MKTPNYKDIKKVKSILAEVLQILEPMQAIIGKLCDDEETKQLLNLPARDLECSVRTEHFFERAGIKTLGDLLRYSLADIVQYRHVGMKTVCEIADIARERGFKMRPGELGYGDYDNKLAQAVQDADRRYKDLVPLRTVPFLCADNPESQKQQGASGANDNPRD